MKISFALLSLATAEVCGDCDAEIQQFGDWVNNDQIICSRYTDPRAEFEMRGACKECKVQCVPVEEACPGVQDLEAGFWNRTTKKVLTQYIQRAADIASEREFQRRENQFAKEQAKYENIKNKIAEKAAKAANKAAKLANYTQWREDRRLANEAARAQKKVEKKERKAAAKAAKELRKEMREQKRLLADENKALFAFYADVEEHYVSVCPDMFLIKDNSMARSFDRFKMEMN